MTTSGSDKTFVYRTIEDNRVRMLYIAGFILAVLVFSVGIFFQIRDDKISIVQLFFILIYPFIWLLPRLKQDYLINEYEKTVKIPSVKEPVKIELITKIEVFKNKKGGIKRVTLRIPPYRFFPVQAAEKLKFINHLRSLNENIELVEK